MNRTTILRRFAVLASTALVGALLPGVAAAQERAPQSCLGEVPAADFDDRDRISEAHRAAVDCLAHLEVVEGLGHDEGVRYLPGAEIRRDQMAAYLVRALEAGGAELPAPRDQGFEDVEGRHHADAIRQLAEIGVTTGTSASTYSPGENVTRAQMATFLLRAAAWQRGVEVSDLEGGPLRFDDVAGTHRDTIAGVYHLGITAGVDASTFAPGRDVTRAQMASFVVAAMAAMEGDPATCTNAEAGYTLTMPDGWHTNAGDVVARCSVFDRERFVVEPNTELPADLAVRIIEADRPYEELADEAHREEISSRTDTAGDRAAIVVESEATGEGFYPDGTRIYTWYVDASSGGDDRALVANTIDVADDYAGNRAALDEMMGTLEFHDD